MPRETKHGGISVQLSVEIPRGDRHILASAHGMLETFRTLVPKQDVAPIALVYGSRNPSSKEKLRGLQVYLVTHDPAFYGGEFTDQARDDMSAMIKQMSWDVDAAAVFFASEAYRLSGISAEDVEKYRGRYQDHPDHTEGIMARLEADTSEHTVWTAEIGHTLNDGERSLGQWEETYENRWHVQGRLCNFIIAHSVQSWDFTGIDVASL